MDRHRSWLLWVYKEGFQLRVHRFVGRFYRLRRLSSFVIALSQPAILKSVLEPPSEALERRLEQLRRNGFAAAPPLAPSAVRGIRRFALEAPCTHPILDSRRFLFSEIENGRLADGTPVAVADIVDPTRCAEVKAVATEPDVILTAARYLGYLPRNIYTRLFWSPVSRLNDNARRKNGQTIDFHYDIEACNSFYVYYYITPTGPESGAHVIVPGSHRDKPLSTIMTSALQPEDRVMRYYGRENVAVMSGDAGYGFFEDPSCFHKALAPTQASRLCLQIRYV